MLGLRGGGGLGLALGDWRALHEGGQIGPDPFFGTRTPHCSRGLREWGDP